MTLRYMFAFIRLLKIPGMFSIMKDWQVFVRMLFMFAAYESGLLKALSQKPCGLETLVDELGVERPELLKALLDVGLAVKELGINGQDYYIKGKRSKAAINPRGDMVAAMIQASIGYYSEAYRNAPKRLKGGELGEDLKEIGELVARFSKGIEFIIDDYIKAIVSGKESLRILDAGCGSAFFLRSAYRANPKAVGVGMDIDPAVAAQARDNISNWGLESRFKIFEGDVRNPPPEAAGPFDLINLSSMLYYFTSDERIRLLTDIRGRLSDQGVLSVVMTFHSRGGDAAAANLNVVNCSLKGLQPVPDLEEIKQELTHCGYGNLVVHNFLPASTFQGLTANL